ncbi:MAG: NAD(P) transhydrogenase subunit alpha [Maribacter sp.]|nr:NAD(P) transhydrogenase subunit alpha [Maribacter sp.]
MTIGLLKCTEENLVAMVPQVALKLYNEKFQIVCETEAGEASGYSNDLYHEIGAKIASRKEVILSSDIMLTGSEIGLKDLNLMKPDTLLIGKFNGCMGPDHLMALQKHKATAFSLDLLPRSSIAQSMDVLSSLASLSGYKALITAADEYEGYLPMMTTSAGTMPPARVLILGAGVAGLQAIATAKRLGAVVEAFDVRSSVKEEVQSLGAEFIEVEGSIEDDSSGGYAIRQTAEYIKQQKALIHSRACKADIIITTANIPNKKAPILIEKDTVAQMKPGSVIVDMASASGGNCELSRDGEMIVINGVKIIGDSKLYNKMAHQASLLYSNNIHNFLKYLLKDGRENVPYGSDIVSSTLVKSKEAISLHS